MHPELDWMILFPFHYRQCTWPRPELTTAPLPSTKVSGYLHGATNFTDTFDIIVVSIPLKPVQQGVTIACKAATVRSLIIDAFSFPHCLQLP